MTEAAHSAIGASSCYRWSACPGSVRLSQGIVDNGNFYAREGTAAHELGERCLKNGFDAGRFLDETIVVANDAFTVDEDMAEAVQVYLDTVRAIYEPGDVLQVEHRFNLESIHPGMFGTCDSVIYRPKTAELFVIDYKHGKGVPVEVTGNLQLRYYGLGAALSSRTLPLDQIHLIVVQPRAPHSDGPVRRETIDALDLLDFSANLLDAVLATEDPDAPLNAGDWCGFCPAAGRCPALRHTAAASARMDFATPGEMSGDELAAVMEQASLIEDWLRAVRAYVFEQLEAGGDIPGYKLVAKRALRKWRSEDEAAGMLALLVEDENDLYARKLKSPAAVEKLLPKDERDLLKDLTVKESSGNTLARETDKREAVNIHRGDEFEAVD